MQDRVGQHIDDYRLIRLLGTGSFGEVYLGEHLKSQNLVAVKMLNLNQENLKEFVKEASTAFRLKHPHIIPLLAFGMSADDTPYLVMDYASNGTLRQRHPKGTRLPFETIVSYLLPLAEALQYAHDRRVIHRDVKPDNVLIGQDGKLLLSDFGIAVIAPIGQSLNTQNLGGTAPYMAPEQIRGKPQPASDQYALGIMAYEWLCGVRPFQGTVWELLDQHRSQSPPLLREKLPNLPPVIEEIIFKALAKDPHDRFATIQEFATALDLVCQGKTILRTSVDNIVSLSSSVGQEVQPMVGVVTLPNTLPPVAVPSEPSQGRTSDGLPDEDVTSLLAGATPVVSQMPLELQSYRKQSWKRVAIIVSLLLMLISGSTLYTLLGFPPFAYPSFISGARGNRLDKKQYPLLPTAHAWYSCANFGMFPSLTVNTNIEYNDSHFVGDHVILGNNQQITIAFPVSESDLAKQNSIAITALVSRFEPFEGYSPIDISINNRTFVTHFIMSGGGYNEQTTTFTIPANLLTVGKNTATIQVAPDARSNFWLYNVAVGSGTFQNDQCKLSETIPPTAVLLTPTVDSQATAVAQQAVVATQTAVAGEAVDTATAVAQITATAQVSTPDGLYSTVTSQPPSFSDSLAVQSARNWSLTTACTFSGGKYVISSAAGYFQPCYAVGTNLCNLGYQVQMTALGGDGGGLIFRYASNEYRLRVSPDGSYDLVNTSYTVTSGSSGAIRKGLNVTNQLTIIAQGSKIYMYVNSQYITSVTDQASSCGAIGLMAVGFNSAGKAAFSGAKVWSL